MNRIVEMLFAHSRDTANGVPMELEEKIRHQRVRHIISSYQLNGDEAEAFEDSLIRLFSAYPSPLIELALVETLVENWLILPSLKGCTFLEQTRDRLRVWQESVLLQDGSRSQSALSGEGSSPVYSFITPEQFQHITGLDPSPIFGFPELPPTQSPSRPFV